MRVTTQMLNETSKRTGIPINQTSLLSYINNDGQSDSSTLLDALQDAKEKKVTAENTEIYQKLEKAADSLQGQAEKFAASGGDSFFDKIKESDDHEALLAGVESYVKSYNDTLSALKKAPGLLNDYYRQMLQETAENNSEALANIGVVVGKDGSLSVDGDKLKDAAIEDVEAVFGSSGEFSSKTSFLADRISGNAQANAESVSSQYDASGNLYSQLASQYDFWG